MLKIVQKSYFTLKKLLFEPFHIKKVTFHIKKVTFHIKKVTFRPLKLRAVGRYRVCTNTVQRKYKLKSLQKFAKSNFFNVKKIQAKLQ